MVGLGAAAGVGLIWSFSRDYGWPPPWRGLWNRLAWGLNWIWIVQSLQIFWVPPLIPSVTMAASSVKALAGFDQVQLDSSDLCKVPLTSQPRTWVTLQNRRPAGTFSAYVRPVHACTCVYVTQGVEEKQPWATGDWNLQVMPPLVFRHISHFTKMVPCRTSKPTIPRKELNNHLWNVNWHVAPARNCWVESRQALETNWKVLFHLYKITLYLPPEYSKSSGHLSKGITCHGIVLMCQGRGLKSAWERNLWKQEAFWMVIAVRWRDNCKAGGLYVKKRFSL